MNRLVDTRNAFDPTQEYLTDLIRAGEPVVVSPARKQRLLHGILLRQQVRRTSPSRLLRPVFVVGVLSLAGATAAATIGRRVWNDRHAAPAVNAPAAPAPTTTRRARPARATVAIADEAPALAPEATAPPRAVRRSKPPARVRITTLRVPNGRLAESEDPSRVVDAVHALRAEHDPARASRLLADYLARYPHGALAEEAIALSIEAAAATHDPAAMVFAEHYLRQYPSGRFRGTAEQALSRRAR